MYRVTYRFAASSPLPGPTEMWRLITSPLPPEIVQAEEGSRVLWHQDDPSTVTVQYPRRPEPSWLLPGTVDFPQVVDMRVLMDALAVGQVWRFDVLGSTVRRPSRNARAADRRPTQYRVSAREWLTDESVEVGTAGERKTSRAYSSGFRLLHLADEQPAPRGRDTTLLTRVRGVLEVEDPDSLRVALEEGLGRGRSKGGGMLRLGYVPRRPAGPPPVRRGAGRSSRPAGAAQPHAS